MHAPSVDTSESIAGRQTDKYVERGWGRLGGVESRIGRWRACCDGHMCQESTSYNRSISNVDRIKKNKTKMCSRRQSNVV